MGFGLVLFGALTGLVGASPRLLGQLPASVTLGGLTLGMPLLLFLVIRSLMGVFATPMYPAAAHAVAHWLPFRRRGWANGLVQGSALLGIASTPLVVGTLIAWFDWPQTFLILAVGTGLLTIVWALYATDRPEQHPAVNAAERDLIAVDHAPESGRHSRRARRLAATAPQPQPRLPDAGLRRRRLLRVSLFLLDGFLLQGRTPLARRGPPDLRRHSVPGDGRGHGLRRPPFGPAGPRPTATAPAGPSSPSAA